MKKLIYILFLFALTMACGRQKPKEKDWSAYIAPDSVWDYSYIDSIYRDIKIRSYKLYGDSNWLEEGLPDSIMRRKDSLERLRH